MRIVFFTLALLVVAVLAHRLLGDPCYNRHQINVNCYGFDKEDSTAYLQQALKQITYQVGPFFEKFYSANYKVIVPNMGSPWITKPLFLRQSNQTVVFEKGVEILAKEGEFHGAGDSLFDLVGVSNVTITSSQGQAIFRMRKSDYANQSKYVHSEHRMGIKIYSSTGVNIVGPLLITETGGDGIYIGDDNRNIVMQHITCDKNYRQGISVISVVNMLAESCIFSNTNGTAPQAGIDFEPNSSENKLANITMRDCTFFNNTGSNIKFYLGNLGTGEEVSITLEGSVVYNGASYGVEIEPTAALSGSIKMFNTTVTNSAKQGLFIGKKQLGSTLAIADMTISESADNPVYIYSSGETGDILFDGLKIYDNANKAFLYGLFKSAHNIDGTADVYTSNATNCTPVWQGEKDNTVALDVSCHMQ